MVAAWSLPFPGGFGELTGGRVLRIISGNILAGRANTVAAVVFSPQLRRSKCGARAFLRGEWLALFGGIVH